MVILSEISGNGKRRRCDARCYNGKPTTRCKCICGGANHAKGQHQAIQNVREMFARLEKADRQSGADFSFIENIARLLEGQNPGRDSVPEQGRLL